MQVQISGKELVTLDNQEPYSGTMLGSPLMGLQSSVF